ncbi:hypothetical protein C8Q80DRAFT_1219502 [Daedaleopsis nitida]|nr:hypothetical protein C8Q80DRAFT_1219502 [Daedaleopsis nitida]
MGILLSILFPTLFMSSSFSPSPSADHTSRSSSPSPDPRPSDPLPPPEDDLPDLSPPSSPKPTAIASPPLDTRPYSPHGVGIGILSPQPVLGPFAPISRASFAPLQVNPREPLAPRASGSRSPEIPPPAPPPPPALRYVDDASTKDGNAGEHIPLTTFSSAGTSQAALRIAIPPPNPTASTSTPSPPLFSQPAHDPVASTSLSVLDPGPSGPILETPIPASSVDLLSPSTDLNIDFSEFDTEGCSALEKIYLFSRSRASFHRVYIAHALPSYLSGCETSAGDVSSKEIIEQITPNEAVEYVLPLLNGLALDEDEAVKEALAAELVPVIWWFVTHCRLVEDDTPPPPSPPAPTPLSPSLSPSAEREPLLGLPTIPGLDPPPNDREALAVPGRSSTAETQGDVPTAVSVQAFTPILGTLLLSPNGIVGGSARYAVVELLRRLRRADQREGRSPDGTNELVEVTQTVDETRASSPTPSQTEYEESEDKLEIGLFQSHERRLFERELVWQVVIGMGRLDLDDHRVDGSGEDMVDIASDSDASTAVPTPRMDAPAVTDSYFPMATTDTGLATIFNSSALVASPPVLAAELSTFITSTQSPASSPSPPVSSTSSLSSGSPGHSSASTPSLTSSTSSGDSYDNAESAASDTAEVSGPESTSLDGFERHVPNSVVELPIVDDVRVLMDVDEVSSPKVILPAPYNWAAPGSYPRNTTLPTTPPIEVPPPPPIAAPVPVSPEAALPLTGVPLLPARSPSSSPASEVPPARQLHGWMSPGSAARQLAATEDQPDDGSDLNEEASVGRLSSMSLMAAVTASGSIGEDTKMAFVAEVERVGRDPVYWVRREASFAVGALAKVVPVEVVASSLLPLFESLCTDPTWHVRHSVLFALPAILSRLTPPHRRKLALDVILPLSEDEESTVRSAVLEALGEVMYTFKDDEGGPPVQLLKLFLGIRETEDPGGGHSIRAPDLSQKRSPQSPQQSQPQSATSTAAMSSAWSDYGTDAGGGPDIYDDPQRPLVCAFNYPAVALTLGRERWPELRPLYLSLVQDPSFKIRRTLAASLGEIAKIIGEEHARADLLDVFWTSLRAEESEVRMKVIEALPAFVRALGLAERALVAEGLEEALSSSKLSSWREREVTVKALGDLVEINGIGGEVLRRMVIRTLDDRVAAVREAAVGVMPTFFRVWKAVPHLLETLQADVRTFATSPAFRKRTTWVTCAQEVLAHDQGDAAVRTGTFWETLSELVRDPIVDVRIRVARLLGLIFDKFGRIDSGIAAKTLSLARDLTQDPSHEVQAFATAVLAGAIPSGSETHHALALTTLTPRVERSVATFSRPPPPNPS